MADERDDHSSDRERGNAERRSLGTKGKEGSFGGQSSGQRPSDGTGGQPIGGNDSNTGSGTTLTQGADFGTEPELQGSGPPRSLGTHGSEFGQMSDYDRSGQQGQSGTGQADLGTQSGATLSGHTDQQDLDTDQPGRAAGATGRQGEGFIAQRGTAGSSSEQATDGSDSAREGRGALDEHDDSEGDPTHSAFPSGRESGSDKSS